MTTTRLVQLPIHASWLNQVEIYFSIVHRKVLTPNDFTDPDQVQSRLLAFERRYEQATVPFQWKYTRSHLAKLMATRRQNPTTRPPPDRTPIRDRNYGPEH